MKNNGKSLPEIQEAIKGQEEELKHPAAALFCTNCKIGLFFSYL
jgi:hypothetical protein